MQGGFYSRPVYILVKIRINVRKFEAIAIWRNIMSPVKSLGKLSISVTLFRSQSNHSTISQIVRASSRKILAHELFEAWTFEIRSRFNGILDICSRGFVLYPINRVFPDSESHRREIKSELFTSHPTSEGLIKKEKKNATIRKSSIRPTYLLRHRNPTRKETVTRTGDGCCEEKSWWHPKEKGSPVYRYEMAGGRYRPSKREKIDWLESRDSWKAARSSFLPHTHTDTHI